MLRGQTDLRVRGPGWGGGDETRAKGSGAAKALEQVYGRATAVSNVRCSVPLESLLPITTRLIRSKI